MYLATIIDLDKSARANGSSSTDDSKRPSPRLHWVRRISLGLVGTRPHAHSVTVALPDDFVYDECLGCEAKWFNGDLLKRLTVLLKERK